MNRFLKGVDPAVFWGSAVLISGFVGWGLFAPASLGTAMSTSLSWVIGNFGWGFVLIAFGGLAFCIFLVIHPWGSIRLGPDDSRPDFGTFSWVSMMFAAGLGAGLLFFGTAEPVSHWIAPPHGLAEPRTEEATLVALRYTYFHWGFNGWALYAVMGGAMAYFSFRKGMPTLVSATFTPVLGPNASERPLGRLVDALAIVATLFGTATALGLNGLQLNSGLDYLLDVPKSNSVAVIIIVIVTALFLVSATSGVKKGINFLANLGSFATIGLFAFFLFLGGATVMVISEGIESIGTYLVQVIPMSLQTGVGDEQWMAGWTIFYWAWWISWAPFVGMFVARISRGRTMRIRDRRGRGADRLRVPVVRGRRRHRHRAAEEREGRHRLGPRHARALAVHGTRRTPFPSPQLGPVHHPDRPVLHQRCGRGLDRDGNHGHARPLEPGRLVVIVLGALMGAIACAMLLVGGLVALQQAAVLGAVPFTFVVVGVAWCWIKALREETRQPDGGSPRSSDGGAGAALARVPADTTETDRPEPGATPGTGPGSTGPGT